jgi:DNA-binding Lrp family transcriptional regulator
LRKKKKDLVILSHLRSDARKSLVDLSKKTGIPASTIYDRVNVHEKGAIRRYTALLDFEKLGFHGRVYVAVKLDNPQKREELLEFLQNHNTVNSIYKINLGYHYLFEAVFKNVSEAESFIDVLQDKFGLDEKHIFNIIEEVKKEEFLTRPEDLEVAGVK